MSPSLEDFPKALLPPNINFSYQRMKVLEYLTQNHCHPTVDQLHADIKKEIPLLSKTTVYSTLRVLIEAGLVRVITIEDNETRYDIKMEAHGHFKYEPCGEIYNFNFDAHALKSNDLLGFKIDDKDAYFKGICPNCLLK